MIDFNLVDANGSVSVRAFANKSAATRYANKNGLTIATSVGALALIADTDVATLDTDDVDSVLASLDATDATAT